MKLAADFPDVLYLVLCTLFLVRAFSVWQAYFVATTTVVANKEQSCQVQTSRNLRLNLLLLCFQLCALSIAPITQRIHIIMSQR